MSYRLVRAQREDIDSDLELSESDDESGSDDGSDDGSESSRCMHVIARVETHVDVQ